MITLRVIEWQRLVALRSTRVLAVMSLVLTALGTAVYAALAGQMTGDAHGLDARELVSAVVSQGSAAPMFAGLIAAVTMTGDFKYGILARSVLVTSNRRRLIGARLMALVVAAAMLAACSWLIGAVLAWTIQSAALVNGLSPLAVVDGLASHMFVAAAWAVAAASVAMLVRSQIPVAIGCIVYPLVIEPMFHGVVALMGASALRWAGAGMPWAVGAAVQQRFAVGPGLVHLVSPAADRLHPVAAVAVLAALVAMVAWAGGRAFSRRSLV